MMSFDKTVLYTARLLLTLGGCVGGFFLNSSLMELIKSNGIFSFDNLMVRIGFAAFIVIIFGLIGFIISQPLSRAIVTITRWADQWLRQLPFATLLASTVGLILGLLVAALISGAVRTLPIVGLYLPIPIYIVLGYLGISMGYRWRESVEILLGTLKRADRKSKREQRQSDNSALTTAESVYRTVVRPKVVDTSAIIDGRIVEICKSGFLEGPLVITQFVLDELRHIADSGDALKRARGRRGLDILNELQKLDIEILNVTNDYEDILEVDAKLVKLAQDWNGYVVTNDFNLNKVASFQKVRTLNVNELASAIKTVVLPGEAMRVEIVSRGKENDQGVGYLDDGTMIVVENGKNAIGQIVDTVVTSVIQTNAGRMIFVRLAE